MTSQRIKVKSFGNSSFITRSSRLKASQNSCNSCSCICFTLLFFCFTIFILWVTQSDNNNNIFDGSTIVSLKNHFLRKDDVSSNDVGKRVDVDRKIFSRGSNVVDNPEQKSKFAYTTLISGINKSRRYRGFLYNALIMRRSLLDAGSTADFVAMIGYSDDDIVSIVCFKHSYILHL